jgi:predicted TIM-barrel fold metal-dependent hydrolase
MLRIDTHHHMIPPDYRDMLRRAGIDETGGRALPDWSPEGSLQTMADLGVATAILSVSTPGTTFLPDATDAAALARDLNDYGANLVPSAPDRFGFFATVPMPHMDESVAESVRALDDLEADGVVLLANNAGTYLGQDGQDDLFAALDARSAVVFIHPADLPGPTVPGVAPFAADFLLDTTRAAYLLVRNGIRRKYPNIRFILSHAGGFVPYASHRMAVAIMAETGASPAGFRSAIGVQEAPRPRRGVQVEPGIDVAEVVAGEFSDARQPVAQRAAMDVQCSRGFVIISTALQVIAQGHHQFGVLAVVVIQECAKPFAHKAFDLAAAVCGVDEAIETEFVERRCALWTD